MRSVGDPSLPQANGAKLSIGVLPKLSRSPTKQRYDCYSPLSVQNEYKQKP